MESKRKPYNDRLGYVASRRHYDHRGWMVIYDNKNGQLGIDASYRWITSCETHGTMVSSPSLKLAREAMKSGEFCEECT